MDTKELQKTIDELFVESFGHSSLRERHNDILGEAIELSRTVDIRGMKEETGDLLCSAIQSCNENGWELEDVIQGTLAKIKRRQKQYKTLGRKRRVVIQGGAFNMIHNGHIEAAQIVLNHSSDFDEVWLTPCYKHLYGKDLASAEDRLEMCRIAARVDARIRVFDYEITHEFQGETYHFMKLLMNDPVYKDFFSFSLMIGLDNANTITQWSNYEDLLKIVPFVVINRQGYVFEGAEWCLKQPHRYIDPDVPPVEVNSTRLRECCGVGNFETVASYLDKDVIEYIKSKGLYKI
ncbi:MAG: MazG nucleotide pyrophosphohydrolase domain-containing protein [Candidatus Nanoarchaeia archaeon]|jgi:nicotinate-nucleotide adenylyltransferase|nr:MazG nucleotide pyrophosphohydrolase domain-containing protein [Candidatus Nanoarchaeia archaeon]